QDLKEMVETLKLKARQGDTAAIKLILQYCVGKPAPPHDPDRMDADEWDRLRQMSVGQEQFDKTMETIPACLACHVAQAHWPCNGQAGPLAETAAHVHSQLRAGGQPSTQASDPGQAAPGGTRPGAAAAQPGAAAVNQTGESRGQTDPTVPAPST